MRHAAPPIGIAETARGLLISLPPRFWLVVSLRRSFRSVIAEPAAWTYCIRDRNVARDVELWVAEVELRLRAESRQRAWTASDAEWLGQPAPAPAAAPEPVLPAIGPDFAFTLPKGGIAKATLKLLARLAAGDALMLATSPEGQGYLLGNRPVRASVVARAIAAGLVVPAGDGLLGPEFSQTWRLAPEAGRR